MNSIIVSETYTAPRVPIHVPLTQLAPPSKTCCSCPNSVTPHPHHSYTPFAPSLTESSNFQSIASPPTQNHSTLLLYSPGSQPMGFSLFFRPAEGWTEGLWQFCIDCGGDILLYCVVVRHWWQCEVVGVEFGHGSFSVEKHNRTMNPQRNVPPTAIIIRRELLNPFE